MYTVMSILYIFYIEFHSKIGICFSDNIVVLYMQCCCRVVGVLPELDQGHQAWNLGCRSQLN